MLGQAGPSHIAVIGEMIDATRCIRIVCQSQDDHLQSFRYVARRCRGTALIIHDAQSRPFSRQPSIGFKKLTRCRLINQEIRNATERPLNGSNGKLARKLRGTIDIYRVDGIDLSAGAACNATKNIVG